MWVHVCENNGYLVQKKENFSKEQIPKDYVWCNYCFINAETIFVCAGKTTKWTFLHLIWILQI